uniref:Transmembrane protein 54 n=1 Tax=Athene cunicularia TaxID=194338 RepID=A0A663MW13_ATHCN
MDGEVTWCIPTAARGVHRRVLMKTGLILLIIGHLNFITGALVHGIVLRFVVNPRDAVSLQYAVANTASIISALLVPRGAGIHLLEDFFRSFLWSRFIFGHVHHGGDHFVDGLGEGDGDEGGCKVGACHRSPEMGDRTLGFAALGAGLVFNTLPVRSGSGELQLPAQPGRMQAAALQEERGSRRQMGGDATEMSPQWLHESPCCCRCHPAGVWARRTSPIALPTTVPLPRGARGRLCVPSPPQEQGEWGQRDAPRDKGMSPGQGRSRGCPG